MQLRLRSFFSCIQEQQAKPNLNVPIWTEDAASSLWLPARFAPDYGVQWHRPWLMALAPGTALSGSTAVPLLGLGGVYFSVKGKVFVTGGPIENLVYEDGDMFALAARSTRADWTRGYHNCGFFLTVLDAGEVLWLPPLYSAGFVGMHNDEKVVAVFGFPVGEREGARRERRGQPRQDAGRQRPPCERELRCMAVLD